MNIYDRLYWLCGCNSPDVMQSKIQVSFKPPIPIRILAVSGHSVIQPPAAFMRSFNTLQDGVVFFWTYIYPQAVNNSGTYDLPNSSLSLRFS